MIGRRYLFELACALVAYAVLLIGAVFVLKAIGPGEPWRTAVTLSPMLAFCAVAWIVLREFRRLDELQLRIQLEALAAAVALAAIVTFGWGFLELIGYPKFPTFGVWPVLGIGWMGGAMVARRRYR